MSTELHVPPPVPPSGSATTPWMPHDDELGDEKPEFDVIAELPAVAAALAFACEPDVRAADVHLGAGEHPWLRIGGTFEPAKDLPVLPADEVWAAIKWCGGPECSKTVLYPQGSKQRWRGQTWEAMTGPEITLRRINAAVPDFDELGASIQQAREVASYGEGLVVVAGQTGSGKSTTLAGIVSLLNKARACHIITIENPIEYRYESGLARIRQREIGVHVPTAVEGFHSALRSDLDVILLGELRTPEETELCLDAAVSGHLVLTTMHAKNAGTVCERLLAGQDDSARSKLAQAYRMVIAQRLVPDAKNPQRRHLIAEICPASRAIINRIRPGGELSLLDNDIRDASKGGMDARLAEAVVAGDVTDKAARLAAIDQRQFEQALQNLGLGDDDDLPASTGRRRR